VVVSGVFTLPASLRDEIVEHARAGLPNEACGILGGPEGTAGATSFHPTRNEDESPYRYSVHSSDLVRVWSDLDDSDEAIVGIYHSHTRSAPFPSRTDVERATWPEAAYVIVSLRSDPPELAAFRLADGKIEELALEIA
jgi:proteasome lid subunit RPN8/RPN11